MADSGAKRAATISQCKVINIFGSEDDKNKKAGPRTSPCSKRVCQTPSTLDEPKHITRQVNSRNNDKSEEGDRKHYRKHYVLR